MSTSIYWFRNDLRVTDNPSLAAACAGSARLSLVYVMPHEAQALPWDFPRYGPHRLAFLAQALQGLDTEVSRRGGALQCLAGPASAAIVAHAREIGANRVFCETVAAPEEIAEVAGLRAAGLTVLEMWQSGLLDPADLPFAIDEMPEMFTAFRHSVERAGLTPPAPHLAPLRVPPGADTIASGGAQIAASGGARFTAQFRALATPTGRAAFPFQDPAYHGSESAALAYVERYFGSAAPQTYKVTRNGLIGTGYSTKLSPWLGTGALSPRTVFSYLRRHEASYGANDSTYWIWFELLWRDFFRLWSMKHGARLFRSRGLGTEPPSHDPEAFARWCAGTTGHAFIDAGMRELAATGYLSNRMRQVVASYLVHDLGSDWRAGAAWFESRLIDYDVCSNHGNWLYIAGRGADPRPRRWFNPDKQAAQYDSDGAYRSLWGEAAADIRHPHG